MVGKCPNKLTSDTPIVIVLTTGYGGTFCWNSRCHLTNARKGNVNQNGGSKVSTNLVVEKGGWGSQSNEVC